MDKALGPGNDLQSKATGASRGDSRHRLTGRGDVGVGVS